MSEFVKKYQCFIKSNESKAVGAKVLREKTDELLAYFLEDITKTVLNGEKETFLIQWAISRLDETEVEKLNAVE